MRADSQWRLTYSDGQWRAEENDLSAAGTTLAELEENIRQALLQSRRFEKNTIVTVFLGTDNRIMPEWIRPYQSHYFNRYLTLKV